MHPEVVNFVTFVKAQLPDFFKDKKVLDVGSGDINGNNRFLFENCEYNGNDLIQAPNVTIVSKTSELKFSTHYFDTIVSTECFEHDAEYKKSFNNILRMLKPNGLFAFTCATLGRQEHGTKRTTPHHSYGTIGNVENWTTYYKNLTIYDLNESIDLNQNFSYYDCYYSHADLYFIGIKKAVIPIQLYIDTYKAPLVTKVRVEDTMDKIFTMFGIDKSSFVHNYSRQYQPLLKPFINKEINILEIGGYNGNTLRAWKYLFPNAKVVGIDINNEYKQYENECDNIFVEIFDVKNIQLYKTLKEKYFHFDLIIDNGSHMNYDVIYSFEQLFPLLNDNGLYIVENTVCYNDEKYVNNMYPNHLNYFVQFIPFLNQTISGNSCVDPFKMEKKTSNIFEQGIDKIEFGCSYVAISKKIRCHWIE
jgi:cyclopropane fatty-acyl-phospholipid synthase-like methyltransferase